jgi:hypothetical protein
MMIHGKSRGVAVLIAAAVGLVGVPASAQQQPAAPPAPAAPTAKPDAKALFASGEKKFKAGDYAGALADFDASQKEKADPQTQLYIAKSHDNLGHYAEAAAAYDQFLSAVPVKMKSDGEEAKKRVEAIRMMPGRVHVETTPAGATVGIDGQPAGVATTPTDIELPPGHHSLKVAAEGFEPATREVDVTFGSKKDVTVELQKRSEPVPPVAPPVTGDNPPAQPPPPPPPPEPRSKVPAYVTGAVAIIAAGVGTGFGIQALSQSNDFKDHPTTKLADDGENNALIADMMFGIAITFGVTSAVLFLSSDTPATAKATTPKKTVTIQPAPYVTHSGGGAGALVSF